MDSKNAIEWLKDMYYSTQQYSTDDGYSKEEYHNEIINIAIQALQEKIERGNGCEYCQKAIPLVIGRTNDYGIAIQYPQSLNAYGYDVHGTGSNGLICKIEYCPMCGRKLV